jgi:cytochrome c oxidase assembly protein Cox11
MELNDYKKQDKKRRNRALITAMLLAFLAMLGAIAYAVR